MRLSRVYTHKMSRFPPSPDVPSPAPFDEAAEARELEEFFRQQDPVDVAAVDWHTRQERGLTEAEQAQFQQWLAASPAHAAAFGQLAQGLSALRAMPAAETARLRAAGDAPAASAAPASRPVAAPAGAGWRAASWLPWNWPGPRLGAAVLACVVLLAVNIGWHQWMRQPTFTRDVAVERGQRQTVTLPDGSELAIDVDTRAHVALYRDRREVRIVEGEVMFAVAPDGDRPFQVQAGAARVTVVGTRFSVRYRATGMDAGAVKVAVEEGHVRVAGLRGAVVGQESGQAIDLKAGQGVTVTADGGTGPVATVAPGAVGLWRKGLVRFENTPLGDALLEMERYGPTGLAIGDPAVAAMPLGGSFRIGRPGEFARMLPQILPVELARRADGQTEITRAP